jgi:hypothetical protein
MGIWFSFLEKSQLLVDLAQTLPYPPPEEGEKKGSQPRWLFARPRSPRRPLFEAAPSRRDRKKNNVHLHDEHQGGSGHVLPGGVPR